MADLAEMIRAELGADPDLIRETALPSQMTLVKRPTLDRQRTLLGFEPEVSLAEGVGRVCACYQRTLVNSEHSANGQAESSSRRDGSRPRGTPMDVGLTPVRSRLVLSPGEATMSTTGVGQAQGSPAPRSRGDSK